ncbi:hypothetical protein JW992_01925 [candidate division KSB1 bacterium]|nr:hypothetical protein [candidate division KSB1 bacterium]
MDYLVYGKKIVLVLAAMVIGLVLGLELLEAHVPRQSGVSTLTSARLIEAFSSHHHTETLDLEKRRELELPSLPISTPEVQKWLALNTDAEPEWIVYTDGQLYALGKDGRLLGRIDSLQTVRTPLISGSGFRVEVKSRRLVHSALADLYEFAFRCNQADPRVLSFISEIQLDPQLGLVATVNHLPAILGTGAMDRKVDYLRALLQPGKASPYLSQAAYLDFRLNGQVVLKKRTG